MGISLLFAGLIFLFNPCYNIIDVIPDFIGYILIIFFLSKWRDINSRFSRARRHLIYLAYVSASKIVTLLASMFVPDKGILLIFSTVYFVAELILMLIAFNSLFDGFLQSATIYDGSAVAEKIGMTKTITIIFIIVHNVFNLLPELSFLYIDELEGYVLMPYKNSITIVTMVISLAFGIVWLVYMFKFKKALLKDTVYIDKIERRYNEEILPDTDRFFVRRHNVFFKFITFGSIFMCDIYIDGFDILPDIVCCVCLVIGFIYISRYVEQKLLYGASCAALTLASITQFIFQKSITSDLRRSEDDLFVSKPYFFISIVSVILTFISVVMVLVSVFRISRKLIKNHVGKSNPDNFGSVEQYNREIRRSLNVVLVFYLFFGAAVKVSGIIASYFYYWNVYSENYVYVVYGNIAASVLWVVFSVMLFGRLSYRMEERYLKW